MANIFSLAVNFLKGKKEKADWLESIVMDKQLAADYIATRDPKDRHSFCFAPSSNMYFSQNGEVKVCCHNTEYAIGTYPLQSIHEIWNSKEANELREYMRKFDLSHGCSYCAFDMHLGSFDQIAARHFDDFSKQNAYPAMMEFLLTNTCNLECIMCMGEYSSSIRKNREKLPPIISPYDKAFIEQLKEFIPHLKETRFSGSGEAFSIDMNYEIWEQIITLKPSCIIMIQSNGTYLNARIKDILERGNFEIGISLDSLNKETFEAIRLNASFDRVMENVQYFSECCKRKKTRFSISTCVMRQNWHELPAFVNFCNSIGAIATFHKVWAPEEFALHNLSVAELRKIYEQLSSVQFSGQSKTDRLNINHYHYFVSVIKKCMETQEEAGREKLSIEELEAEELLPYLQKKTKAYFETELPDESSRVSALQNFNTKFASLLELYPDTADKELVMRKACESPSKTMLYSFEKHSLEFLFSETQKRVLNRSQ